VAEAQRGQAAPSSQGMRAWATQKVPEVVLGPGNLQDLN
jgi:hypothetical protein